MPKKTKKDYIKVSVGRLPGVLKTIALNGGRKVTDALKGAELSCDGYEIRVNGSKAKLEKELKHKDTVLLVKQVKGN